MTDTDLKHLEWLYERMKNVHGENEHCDFMIKFREILEALRKQSFSDDLPDFLYESDGEIKIGYHSDTVVTDEWNKWKKENQFKKAMTGEQINEVFEWLKTWPQIRNTAIPLKFREEFKNRQQKENKQKS